MTVMPRVPLRRSRGRRSSFVAPADYASTVPDALSWRDSLGAPTPPKGQDAWSAASVTDSNRTVIDAGPYGVIDIAPPDPHADAAQWPHLGVVWWDKRSFLDEGDIGVVDSGFSPATVGDHVSLTGGPAGAESDPSAPASWVPAPLPAVGGVPATGGPASGGAQAAPGAFAPGQPAAYHAPAAPRASPMPAAPTAAPAAAPSPYPAAAPGAMPSPGAAARAHAAAPGAGFATATPATALAGPPAPHGSSNGSATALVGPPAPSGPSAPFAPPISANRPSGLEETRRSRVRRSRHAAPVVLTPGGRSRSSASSHPRRARLRRRRTRRRIVLGIILVIVAFVTTVLIQSAFVAPFIVPSASMEGSLMTGDHILVNKLAYASNSVGRGDVVVFHDPGGWLTESGEQNNPDDDYLVKRVIGVPGDHVSCCGTDGRVKVNGVELYEPYAIIPSGQPASSGFEVTVPAGALWVLGDNRYNSRDSSQTRDTPSQGFVPIANVIGQATLAVWPFDRFGAIDQARSTFASVPDQTCAI